VRSGIVGAGADGLGAPPMGEGALGGTGGPAGGAIGIVADGTDGGASPTLRVTRTVSFFSGTLDVCEDGVGGRFSFSLMRLQVFLSLAASKTSSLASVKPPTLDFFK